MRPPLRRCRGAQGPSGPVLRQRPGAILGQVGPRRQECIISISTSLRITLVGAGSMGSLHARVIAGSDRARLVAVVDPDEQVGRATAERYGARWAPLLEDALDVDAVVVAAGTRLHRDIGGRVLDHGLPLLMEKPLADSLPDSRDLVLQSEKLGVPLMCGLLERYNPGILTAMSLLEEPLHVTAQRHSPYVSRIRSGVATDLLIHDADIAVRMMGAEPVLVRGSLGYLHPDSDADSEDVAEALLTFGTGAIADLSASRMSQRKVRSFAVSELNRLVEVDMLRNTVTLFHHVVAENPEQGTTYKQQTIIEIPQLVSGREPLATQLDHFVALARGDADADVERAGILPAHRVVDAVRQAARTPGA